MSSNPSKVFFLPWESRERLAELLVRSCAALGLGEGDYVAIKMHFGEKGNDGYIRPEYVRPVLQLVRKQKAVPFLTDTGTIYHGPRNNAVGHLLVAADHGFSQTRLQTPVIIADGLRGDDYAEVPVDGEHYKKVKIGSVINKADSIIALSHFKGHLLTGFGGAIKNLGMGCASRLGKFEMHSGLAPTFNAELCTGCGACIEECAHGALSLVDGKATIDTSLCVGCGECVLVCNWKAIELTWDENTSSIQEKIAEYAAGAAKGKRAFYLNFLNHITPNCDCMSKKEEPLLEDIGILASSDPVAIDQASFDLVVKKAGDVFAVAHPGIDSSVQLAHAEKMGIGTRKYGLIEI